MYLFSIKPSQIYKCALLLSHACCMTTNTSCFFNKPQNTKWRWKYELPCFEVLSSLYDVISFVFWKISRVKQCYTNQNKGLKLHVVHSKYKLMRYSEYSMQLFQERCSADEKLSKWCVPLSSIAILKKSVALFVYIKLTNSSMRCLAWKPGMSNSRPAGRVRPSSIFFAVRISSRIIHDVRPQRSHF
jgi:hypothetical protein